MIAINSAIAIAITAALIVTLGWYSIPLIAVIIYFIFLKK